MGFSRQGQSLNTCKVQHLSFYCLLFIPLGASFTVPLTLEQHGCELHGSAYVRFFQYTVWEEEGPSTGGLSCPSPPPPGVQGPTVQLSCTSALVMWQNWSPVTGSVSSFGPGLGTSPTALVTDPSLPFLVSGCLAGRSEALPPRIRACTRCRLPARPPQGRWGGSCTEVPTLVSAELGRLKVPVFPRPLPACWLLPCPSSAPCWEDAAWRSGDGSEWPIASFSGCAP